MEKGSFERMLRDKVLQAESTLAQTASKEQVWNAIQQKQQPKRKWYYAITAILVVIGVVSVLYVKEDKMNTVARNAGVEKPLVVEPLEPQILQPSASTKLVEGGHKKSPHAVLIKKLENKSLTESTSLPKESTAVVLLSKVENVVVNAAVNIPIENKIQSIAATLVPEFTVQFKRGRPADEVEMQTKEVIARLKKFKLSKNTSILANTNEKQKGLFKIKF